MKHTLTLLAALLGLPSLLSAADSSAAQKPNILFIMVDEMKWNVMGCAGNAIVKTPNLDQLASEGTRFATAYTAGPSCRPSRYSFFTSRYPHVHGAVDNGTPTREPQLLLPDILKHAGYQTAISGKLHFAPDTIDFGFDYFWSFAGEGPHTLPTWPQDLLKKHGIKGANKLEIQPFPDDPLGGDLGKVRYPNEDSQSSWITDHAVEFMRLRDAERPFFLYVSYLDPHSPSHLSEPYWNMFDPEKIPLPPTFKQDPGRPSVTLANRHDVNDPAIVKAMTAAYYAKMKRLDDNLGRLLGQLSERGLAENTLIIFTADHGNMLGDLNRWFKGVLYEGSVRIPLLVKAPAASPFAAAFNRGAVVSNLVENIDVMPTLCEMAGVPLPAQGIQGRSLTKLVAGVETDWKKRVFADYGGQMIRTEQYKLITNGKHSQGRQLFDMIQDPQETNNLADDPAHAEVVRELSEQIEAWQKDVPPVPVIEGVAPRETGVAKEKKRRRADK